MYLSEHNAGRIDYFRKTIGEWNNEGKLSEQEYRYLLACLIESMSFVSNTAGVYGAFLKKWDERALKDIQFMNLSDEVQATHQIQVYTNKLENIIKDVKCDILYLDPPYTQNQYGTQYHLLETLILNDEPENISKVTGSRSTREMRSDWSKIYKVHILLDKILAETTAEHIFLSYNNAGDMSKEYIESIMKRYGMEETFECIKIPYKKYENWKSQNTNTHFEYLFYIKKKSPKEVVYESPLNYIGSKAKVIPYIRENVQYTSKFVDVFGGGFNVGINSDSDKIYYNDINFIVKELIESFKHYDTYEYITYVKKFIEKHQLEKGNKENYLAARDYYNSLPENKKDIRMLFSIILYSYQQQIRFNGNYGFNNTAGVRWFNDCILAKLISFSRVIKEKDITFISTDYIKLKNYIDIDENTFLYMDPPYKLTTGSYNDGKRGFKGWDDHLEQELFDFIDEMTEKNVPCMLSYVLEHKGNTNTALEDWINRNDYTYIPLGDIIGISGQPRKEILILNYDVQKDTKIYNQTEYAKIC
jgi:adenine-specific DNA-methyltransferase